jgi:hypothetical protein
VRCIFPDKCRVVWLVMWHVSVKAGKRSARMLPGWHGSLDSMCHHASNGTWGHSSSPVERSHKRVSLSGVHGVVDMPSLGAAG